jgi:hypothetical protein
MRGYGGVGGSELGRRFGQWASRGSEVAENPTLEEARLLSNDKRLRQNRSW